MSVELSGCILTPQGFVRGTLRVDAQGRIDAVRGEPIDEAAAQGGPFVLPGFVDAHVHGGGGFDVMDGGSAAQSVARAHARHGTTALAATIVLS